MFSYYSNKKAIQTGESLGALIVVIFLLFFGIRNIKNFGKPFCDFFEAKINFQELTNAFCESNLFSITFIIGVANSKETARIIA